MDNIKKLSKLKTQYDEKLKELENRPGSFRDGKYGVYFKESVFDSEIKEKMRPEDRKAYGEGAGGELEEKENGQPAKMSSVASSSRFCYLSLGSEVTDFSVFGIKNVLRARRERQFEEKLPVVKGTPPHMDCVCKDGDELVCFECKCHEQFDEHRIELSEAYFKDGRLVTKIPKECLKEKTVLKKDKNGVFREYRYVEIDPEKTVGLPACPMFDLKQFFTHIMGIQARLAKTKKSRARLIYYWFIPDETSADKEIKAVIEELYKEIRTVFTSPFAKENAANIEFELYVQVSKTAAPASNGNTKKIFPEGSV